MSSLVVYSSPLAEWGWREATAVGKGTWVKRNMRTPWWGAGRSFGNNSVTAVTTIASNLLAVPLMVNCNMNLKGKNSTCPRYQQHKQR